MARAAIRLIVRGHVQGVGFRWFVTRQAERLGIDGWVLNHRDGSVEALAIGEPAVLDAIAEACRHGPPGAAVRAVEREAAKDDGSRGYGLRHTV